MGKVLSSVSIIAPTSGTTSDSVKLARQASTLSQHVLTHWLDTWRSSRPLNTIILLLNTPNVRRNNHYFAQNNKFQCAICRVQHADQRAARVKSVKGGHWQWKFRLEAMTTRLTCYLLQLFWRETFQRNVRFVSSTPVTFYNETDEYFIGSSVNSPSRFNTILFQFSFASTHKLPSSFVVLIKTSPSTVARHLWSCRKHFKTPTLQFRLHKNYGWYDTMHKGGCHPGLPQGVLYLHSPNNAFTSIYVRFESDVDTIFTTALDHLVMIITSNLWRLQQETGLRPIRSAINSQFLLHTWDQIVRFS
jgi:hypothetical protein